jgi:predicted nucleotidyltransferase
VATEEMKALPNSTSEEPTFSPDQRRLFHDLIELLDREDIPYVVAGAFALNAHTGIWRDTKDLDLFLTAESAQKALRVLAENGYQTEVADDVWIAKVHREGYYVDLITGMNNATLTVQPSWVERATRYSVLGVPTRVLGPEELIASKVFVARRERFDGADICHIIYRTGGRIDWDYLLSLLCQNGDHTEMILWHLVLFRYVYPGHSDLVPQRIWTELLSRFEQKISEPDKMAPFRGSLIDENMFFIDVAEWGLANVIEQLREAREPKMADEVVEPLDRDEAPSPSARPPARVSEHGRLETRADPSPSGREPKLRGLEPAA